MNNDKAAKSYVTANKMGSNINLATYTSAKYTTTSDGYATIQGSNNLLQIWGSDETNYAYIHSKELMQSCFVRKGMKLQVGGTGTLTSANFKPLA